MNFIKRNIGFTIYLAVCLIAIVGFSVLSYLEFFKVKDGVTEYRKRAKFLVDLRRETIKLNQKSIDILEKNSDMIKDLISKSQKTLKAMTPAIEKVTMGTEVVSIVRQDVNRMIASLEANDIVVEDSAKTVSFNELLESTEIPNNKELNIIMKHLSVMKYIVRAMSDAEIDSVSSLDRSLGINSKLVDDKYLLTPIEVSIKGEMANIQRFINNINKKNPKLILFISEFTISSDSLVVDGKLSEIEYPKVAEAVGGDRINRTSRTNSREDQINFPIRIESKELFKATDGALSGSSLRARVPRSSQGRSRPSSTIMRKPLEIITRNDIIAFQRRIVIAKIRLDYIDFNLPEEELE